MPAGASATMDPHRTTTVPTTRTPLPPSIRDRITDADARVLFLTDRCRFAFADVRPHPTHVAPQADYTGTWTTDAYVLIWPDLCSEDLGRIAVWDLEMNPLADIDIQRQPSLAGLTTKLMVLGKLVLTQARLVGSPGGLESIRLDLDPLDIEQVLAVLADDADARSRLR